VWFQHAANAVILRVQVKKGERMKRKSPKKLERPTQEGKGKYLETFSPEEQEKIHQLVKELNKIRQVDKDKENIQEQIDMVSAQQFFYVGDFLISEGWEKDRDKVSNLLTYLQLEFTK